MLEDKLDHQWFSIDLHSRINNLDKCKNRLRGIAGQKSEPKTTTGEKHVQAGDIAYQELKAIIDNYFKSKELRESLIIYFEDIDQFFGPSRTLQHMQYQQPPFQQQLLVDQQQMNSHQHVFDVGSVAHERFQFRGGPPGGIAAGSGGGPMRGGSWGGRRGGRGGRGRN